jgi:hypothetical protein
MRIVKVIPLALLFLLGCGPGPEEAVKYNDSIVVFQNRVISMEDRFMESLDGGPEEMRQGLDSLMHQVMRSLEGTKKLGGFHGDESLYQAAVKLLENYKSIVDNEYRTVVELLCKPDEDTEEDDQEKYDDAINEANRKLIEATEAFDRAQDAFSKKHNFTFNPDKIVE